MRYVVMALAAGALLLASGEVQGQGMAAGVKGGMAFAGTSENVSLNLPGFRLESGRRSGVMGGAFLVLPVAPMVAVQPEVLYMGKGMSMDGSFNDPDFGSADFEGELRLSYIHVPVLARVDYAPAATAVTRFHLMAGPYVAFESSCSVWMQAGATSIDRSCDLGEEMPREKLDFGLDLGAGVGRTFAFGTLFVEGRYSHGLRDLSKEGEPEDFDDFDIPTPSIKHRVFGFAAGISVPLGGVR
jgi:hypothetical protein